ncbi:MULTISPECIES: transcriptional regulator [unclassified Anabaena]|uniref:COG1470 family protein n=1 Tax=unclassified Anabaena TaxID=2619674 RepID=UPI001445CCDF|nr:MULTISPECIES: transcriptional regulator [unclassified Anabaena]MTJ07154.1 transcriptional regulator [Anabaena sp. UHCC 0204]MTJ51928.1 transcriptional regulator [Anabaena sp. UHCC 0253]
MNQRTLTNQKPLSYIIDPTGNIVAEAGETFKLRVTVFNQGGEDALINIRIDSIKYIDKNYFGHTLRNIPPSQSLGLNAEQNGEVIFDIEIPSDSIAGLYEYILILDAPEASQHYREERIQHQGKLLIKSFVKSSDTANDPTFTVEPYTSSSSPIPLQPGDKLDLIIKVDNRSQRVDRFRLSCPDLNLIWPDFPKDNLQINYTPTGYTSRSLPTSDTLELNPGEKGDIQVELTIPSDSIAGVYSPTIRIYSDNEEFSPNQQKLVLLDMFYIQVKGTYELDIQMLTKVGKVQNLPGLFELQFYNKGNTVRELKINVESADQENICTYQLNKEDISLLPGASTSINLTVQPPQLWWRRPFYGRSFNFIVEIIDTQDLPLINNRFQGALIWESRPWWHFIILALIILGVITGTGFILWWLLFKPKPLPQIVHLYSESTFYKEINDDAVRLNWQITEANRIKNIQIVGFSPEGIITSAPVVYDFQQGIPPQLQDSCQIKQQVLNCENVMTDARKSGDYNFEITISYQQGKGTLSQSLKTNKINIEPIPQPQIISLTSTQPEYQENALDRKGILLNWEINNPEQIKEVILVGKTPEGAIQTQLKKYDLQSLNKLCSQQAEVLSCKNVPTDGINPGNYLFELAVIPKKGQPEKIEVKKTDLIKIKPIPTQIVEFKIQGAEARPNYIIPIIANQQMPLNVSWKVKGSKNIKVELLPSPGVVQPEGAISYLLNTANPIKETITLQVTNEAGEVITRSTVIETLVPPISPSEKSSDIPNIPPGALSPENPVPTGAGNQTEKTPTAPNGTKTPPRRYLPNSPENDILPPEELPPQFR